MNDRFVKIARQDAPSFREMAMEDDLWERQKEIEQQYPECPYCESDVDVEYDGNGCWAITCQNPECDYGTSESW